MTYAAWSKFILKPEYDIMVHIGIFTPMIILATNVSKTLYHQSITSSAFIPVISNLTCVSTYAIIIVSKVFTYR